MSAADTTTRASRFSEEQWAWGGLAVAMAVSAAVLLWAGRHTTLFADEFTFYQYFHDLDPKSLLTPHNGHLILIPRLIYAGTFQAVGPSHAALAAADLFAVLLCAGLFFVLAKRRVGPGVALALTLPLLFFGSAWDVVLSTLGIAVIYSVVAGLGMLLALERRDLRGDIAACVLLCLSVAGFTLGLGFMVAAAISLLVRRDLRRRPWIVLIPLVAYVGWWAWARQFHQGVIAQASNFLLIPNFIADSIAAVSASIAGLNYPIGSNLQSAPIDIGWGRLLALIAVAAAGWRLWRGELAPSFWVFLAVPLTFWALIATQTDATHTPEQTRYLYSGALLLLLVVAEGLRGVRLPRPAVLVLIGAVAVSLATNLRIIEDASTQLRDFSTRARAELAMVELARQHVDPQLLVATASRDLRDPVNFPVVAGPYLAAADAVGSPAFSQQQVLQQDEPVREDADFTLAHALDLKLDPANPPPSPRGCHQESKPTPATGGLSYFSLPPGGALLDLGSAPPPAIQIRRFAASFAVTLDVPPGSEWVTLRIPRDSAPQPWLAVAEVSGRVTTCPLSP